MSRATAGGTPPLPVRLPRRAFCALLPLHALACRVAPPGQAGGKPQVAVRLEDRAGLPPTELERARSSFTASAVAVYRYHGAQPEHALRVVLRRDLAVPLYRRGAVELPVHDPLDLSWMNEDFVHELTHHILGHDSSFFFKEGFSVHTVEAMQRRRGAIPRAWPLYGRWSADWVAHLEQNHVRLPLDQAVSWPGFSADTPQEDFQSWQVYVMAGAVIGWLIAEHGYARARRAMNCVCLPDDPKELESRWLSAMLTKGSPDFDPAAQLPDAARYRRFADFIAGRAPS